MRAWRFNSYILSAACGALVTLTALPVCAGDFCRQLRAVIASAPSGFRPFRSNERTGLNAEKAIDPLPGADELRGVTVAPCYFPSWTPGGLYGVYECSFHASTNVLGDRDVLISFVKSVSTCLDAQEQQFDFSSDAERRGNGFGSSNRGPFEISAKGARVRIELEYPPDGGLGVIDLRVTRAAQPGS